MKLRIATFNLENLFTRPAAMADGIGAAGSKAIEAHAELNAIVEKPLYGPDDIAVLLEHARTYKFAALSPPSNALVFLNRIRGQLYATSNGKTIVKAKGRADWTGWFELRRSDLKWQATWNCARVIATVKPDLVVCVEAESRPTLLRFNEQVLGTSFQGAFEHVMLIDGNDDRGIDVGLMSRYPINGVRSHVDDRNPNGERTFSRDCPEYAVLLPNGRTLHVMPNHFKSKRGGDDASDDRRLGQSMRVAEIAGDALKNSSLVLIAGDLNDTPDSAPLAPLWKNGFQDVQSHATYPTDRPGTFGTGTKANKIDYLIMSPALRKGLRLTGIERRGSFHPGVWAPFDSVKSSADEASDHHMVWADFTI